MNCLDTDMYFLSATGFNPALLDITVFRMLTQNFLYVFKSPSFSLYPFNWIRVVSLYMSSKVNFDMFLSTAVSYSFSNKLDISALSVLLSPCVLVYKSFPWSEVSKFVEELICVPSCCISFAR